jgi:hypothetical protein
MPLYDIFKQERFGVYQYRHIIRREFNDVDEVKTYCKKHGFKYQEATKTDEQIEVIEHRRPPGDEIS